MVFRYYETNEYEKTLELVESEAMRISHHQQQGEKNRKKKLTPLLNQRQINTYFYPLVHNVTCGDKIINALKKAYVPALMALLQLRSSPNKNDDSLGQYKARALQLILHNLLHTF